MLNAEFTMCFQDVIAIDRDLLDDIIMDTSKHTEKLHSMLVSRWGIYEISGETIQEFKIFLENKFNQYKDYYVERINAYEEKINWLDGEIIKTTNDDSEFSDKNYTPMVSYTTETTPEVVITREDYDLPRSSSSENRPSGKSVSTPEGKETKVVSPDGEHHDNTWENVTKKGTSEASRVNLVKQRDLYLQSIKNLYLEFTEKFKPCFLDMYF